VSGNPSSRIIRFSTFEADLRTGELRRKGQKLRLQEQPFQVLAMLLERPGEVVTREELRIKLWPADTFVDFDHSLNAAINRLRDALGESPETPIFIETLARRGYRFIAPVEKLDDSGHFVRMVYRHGDSASTDRSEELKGIVRLKRRIGIGVAAVCLGAGVVAAKFWPESQRKALRSADSSQLTVGQPNIDHDVVAPAALRLFWSGFISREQEPLVIFSNAKFVGRPEISLHYYDAERDGKDAIVFDHYTGVGETIAVHELDRAFNLMHHEIRVKRGSLLELDDAKNNDLIFVGSPLENLSLLEIPGTQEFVFHRIDSGPRKGDPGLINVHPQPGEPKEFLSSPFVGHGLTEDYGVIALLRGLDSDHSVLILAGNTTMSTQAAVEFVCHPNSINTLLRRISGSANGHLKPFEAVIHVKVSRGVPISSELVALRGGT
jgi:DNA-binding winged helix-turn-helix (wHTH) protein